MVFFASENAGSFNPQITLPDIAVIVNQDKTPQMITFQTNSTIVD